MTFDRALLQDIVTIGSDGLLGMLASLFLIQLLGEFLGRSSWAPWGRWRLIPCSLHSRAGLASLFGRFSASIYGLTQKRKLGVSFLGQARRWLSLLWSSD